MQQTCEGGVVPDPWCELREYKKRTIRGGFFTNFDSKKSRTILSPEDDAGEWLFWILGQ